MSQLLIDYYKAIEDSSALMLEAARSEDWEQVQRFESTCAVLIEQLRAHAASGPNSGLKRPASCNAS